MSFNPNSKQRAVDHACFLAIRAMLDEQLASIRRGEIAADPRLALAGALEAIERERTADGRGLTLPFSIQDCIDHLRATAAPRREQP
jgi:hypothetical protein